MPLAGWCDVEGTWVWVNDDGSCINGHGSEHVTRVYDTDTQNAPPPAPEPPAPVAPAPPYAPASYPAGAPQPPAYGAPAPPNQWQPQVAPSNNRPMLSLILGIISIVGCLPIITIPCAITGIVFGIQGMKTEKRGMAIAGFVLSIIGLVLGVFNAALGAWLGFTGQADLLNQLQ